MNDFDLGIWLAREVLNPVIYPARAALASFYHPVLFNLFREENSMCLERGLQSQQYLIQLCTELDLS